MIKVFYALAAMVIGTFSASSAANGPIICNDSTIVLEKNGIYYELLRNSDGTFNYTANAVGWDDSLTELDIPDEVEIEFPKEEQEVPTRGLGDNWPSPGQGTTRKTTVIIWFTRPYYTRLIPGNPSNVEKILLGSNIKVNGTFSEFSKLKTINLPAKVEEIPDSMFMDCKSLTSITIPKTANRIGMYAFADCTNLTTVNFESNNTHYGWYYIEGFAFRKCSSLKSINLPTGSYIMEGAFDSCESLETVSIKDNINFGGNPFTRCPQLSDVKIDDPYYIVNNGLIYKENDCLIAAFPSTIKEVTIPYNVKSIGGSAFAYCSNLSEIYLPYQIERIDYNAFAYSGLKTIDTGDLYSFGDSYNYRFEGCDKLKKVYIGKNFKKFEASDFIKCNNLIEFIVDELNEKYESDNGLLYSGSRLVSCPGGLETAIVRDGTTSTSEYSFCESDRLTSVCLPNSLENIADLTFRGCTSLKSLVIPDQIWGIYSGTFSNCTNLESLTLGKAVSALRDYAFDGCGKLTSIHVLNPEPPRPYFSDEEDDIFPDFMFENTTVYVPQGSIDKYKSSSLWCRFKNIKESTASINEVMVDENRSGNMEIYNISGRKVSTSFEKLPAGIYIVRQGNSTKKVVVK